MAVKIEFENKESIRQSGFPVKNSVTSNDLNEIKTKFNVLIDEFNDLMFENILTEDLTATADRSQNLNSKKLQFINGMQVKWVNNVAPAPGESSFEYQGYGTTVSDDVFRFKNGAGQSIMLLRGNKRVDMGGDFYSFNGVNYMENIRNPFFVSPGIEIVSNVVHSSRGEIGVAYTSHVFKTPTLITTPGCHIVEYFNFTNKLFGVDKDGITQVSNTPSYANNAAALAVLGTGKLYYRTGHGLDITI